MFPWTKSFSLRDERKIRRNNLLTTIPTLTKEWRVSFDFKANSIRRGFQQVLHMTIAGKGAGSGAKYGDRTPAIWVHSSRGFLISSAVGGKYSYAKYFKPQPRPRRWVKIEVGQELVASEMIYSISINNKEVLSVKNSKPPQFENVKVFAGSPWYFPVDGCIRNLLIEQKGKGRCSSGY